MRKLTLLIFSVSLSLGLSFQASAKAPELVDIPAGSYWMGLCKNNKIYEDNKKRAYVGLPPLEGACGFEGNDTEDNEEPMHLVKVKAFQIGKYEVTFGEFKAFIASTGQVDFLHKYFMENNASGDDAPVVYITLRTINAYIDWLNKTYGGGYRLPSEAEWEYACHAGKRFRYCGSNNLDEVAFYKNRSKKYDMISRLAPVGTKKPNDFGLYDMTGNAQEVVADCRNNSYVGAPADGSAWRTGNCDQFMARGGAVGVPDQGLRATNRVSWTNSSHGWARGFRVARDIPKS